MLFNIKNVSLQGKYHFAFMHLMQGKHETNERIKVYHFVIIWRIAFYNIFEALKVCSLVYETFILTQHSKLHNKQ